MSTPWIILRRIPMVSPSILPDGFFWNSVLDYFGFQKTFFRAWKLAGYVLELLSPQRFCKSETLQNRMGVGCANLCDSFNLSALRQPACRPAFTPVGQPLSLLACLQASQHKGQQSGQPASQPDSQPANHFYRFNEKMQ